MQSRPISNFKMCKSNVAFTSICFEVMQPTESKCIFLTSDRYFQVQKAFIVWALLKHSVVLWAEFPPEHSHLEVLAPVVVLGYGSGRWIGHGGWALMNEISTYDKTKQEQTDLGVLFEDVMHDPGNVVNRPLIWQCTDPELWACTTLTDKFLPYFFKVAGCGRLDLIK